MNLNDMDEFIQKIKIFLAQEIELVQPFDSYKHVYECIVDGIVNIATKYEMLCIKNEMITINGEKQYLDLVVYKDDVSLLSIEVSGSHIKKAITKLLCNESERYLLISIFSDRSLPSNFLKRFDREAKIELLHLPRVRIKNNVKQPAANFLKCTNVDSPLEKKFAEKFREYNINFTSQYAVYERSHNGNMKPYPKYIIDFFVKGAFCKLAIECDGLYYHLRDDQRAYDTERDLWLIKYGFDDVLRFLGDEIHDDLDGCITKIKEAIKSWDDYYRRKQRKSHIKTNEMNGIPSKEDVKLIVNDLAYPIASIVHQIKKREMIKYPTVLVRKLKQLILKQGYSNEIPLLYYDFPELHKYVFEIDGLFIGFNIPFVLQIDKSKMMKKMPRYLKKEKRLLKLVISFEALRQDITNMESYVVIDGWSGKVIQSDILCVCSVKDEGEIDATVKQKFYVVWAGKKTGIFNTWDECKAQVHGVAGARYKSFKSKKEAIEAFKMSYDQFKKRQSVSYVSSDTSQQFSLIPAENYIEESISVDAACSGNPGAMEYKGVYTKNGKEIFHLGPVQNGTKNIGEFLAIVHALALMKQKNSYLPVYSDSLIAIGWIRQKKANTSLPRNEATAHIWNLIDRAENWLNTNVHTNQILKWDTKNWGEIKVDFGRNKSVK